ncbi:MAG: hypothetical protein ABIQ27_07290 [Flavobacterium sp.]|uniref:hypothetical protein n=1 Tax=Flavobacterium sp. TaxID=239 RepID=UPI00326743DB
MINVLRFKKNFLTGLIKPVVTTTSFSETITNTKNATLSKVNSLAYLAYKNRKQKGLIANDSECPTILFGDEWAL